MLKHRSRDDATACQCHYCRQVESELAGVMIEALARDRSRLDDLGLPESAQRALLAIDLRRRRDEIMKTDDDAPESIRTRYEVVYDRASRLALDFLFRDSLEPATATTTTTTTAAAAATTTATAAEPTSETGVVETVRLALLDLVKLVGDRSVMFADRIPARPWDDRVANVERVGEVAIEIAGDVANVARGFMAGEKAAARLSLAEALVGLALLNHDLGLDAVSDLPISIGSPYYDEDEDA